MDAFGVLVPIIALTVIVFSNRNGSFAFGEKQQRQGRANAIIPFTVAGGTPDTGDPILFSDQFFGTSPVPVVRTKKSPPRQPSGSFHSVQIIELAGIASTESHRVQLDRKILSHPIDGLFDRVELIVFATADSPPPIDFVLRGSARFSSMMISEEIPAQVMLPRTSPPPAV